MAWMEKLMMQVALVDQVTKPLAGINAQMDKVSKAGRQGWSSMAMGATTVAAGGMAIQSALGPAIEMDRALAEVASLDVQKEVLGVLGREALKLSIQYGESATEIVRTSYDIQSAIAGLEGNELPAFTRAFTTLAKATKADTAIGQLPDNQAGAVDRVQALAPRAQYRPTTISQAAAQVGLRGELDRLLVIGRCLTVTPYQHGVGQHQGNQYSLAAPNAVATLTAKLQDGADPLLPTGQLHAIAWLVTGNSETALADALAPLCAILPLPEWCAALRRLTASNDAMSKPTAAKVPRWKADEPLVWDPLRSTRSLLGAELAQLESLAQGDTTPIAQLATLAERRSARLTELEQALGKLTAISGQLWHWQAQGDAASLAAQLGQSSPPDHSHSMTVGALLLSPSPLTFWQELTQ